MSAIPVFVLRCSTIFEGNITLGNEADTPDVYPTRELAEREIAEYHIAILRQFLAGERTFDETSVDWFVQEAQLDPETGVLDFEDGSSDTIRPEGLADLKATFPAMFGLPEPPPSASAPEQPAV